MFATTSRLRLPTYLALSIACLFSPALAAKTASTATLAPTSISTQAQSSSSLTLKYQQQAETIREQFEKELFTLAPYTQAHYGLRMYRQTQDPRYLPAIWSDLARVASKLNTISSKIDQTDAFDAYIKRRNQSFDNAKTTRSKLRQQTLKYHPDYLVYGVDILGAMARADEYELMGLADEKLKAKLKQADFKTYFTDEGMIKAWAAQLANQVYWLRQLDVADYTQEFKQSFQSTYPDAKDKSLSDQQFSNKIYGLSHIIFGATEYYQHQLDEEEFAWIYDYYRANIDEIIRRTKPDVIAEVGINFLLAGLDDDPVVAKTQAAISQAIDPEYGYILSTQGSPDKDSGEHRNVLAIMLLDWQGARAIPKLNRKDNTQPVIKNIPYGLKAKPAS